MRFRKGEMPSIAGAMESEASKLRQQIIEVYGQVKNLETDKSSSYFSEQGGPSRRWEVTRDPGANKGKMGELMQQIGTLISQRIRAGETAPFPPETDTADDWATSKLIDIRYKHPNDPVRKDILPYSSSLEEAILQGHDSMPMWGAKGFESWIQRGDYSRMLFSHAALERLCSELKEPSRSS